MREPASPSKRAQRPPARRRAAGPEFLALENASIRLGEASVFPDTSWTWRVGEQWAVLGPDGGGSSLLVELLLGRLPLAAGELRGVSVTPDDAGVAVAHVSPLTHRQLAAHESSFYQARWHSGVAEGQRTVEEFLAQDSVEERNPFEVGAPQGSRVKFVRQRDAFVDWLGLGGLLDRKLVHLSNGELRKTLLVHALLKAPRLLILEDPFAGLDVATRQILHRVIARVMREGMPVLVATCRAEEVPAPVTHLLIVDAHRVVAQGRKPRMLRFWRQRSPQPPPQPGLPRTTAAPASRTRHHSGRPVVEFNSVNVAAAQKPILRDVCWRISERERWVVLGPNGAGKTTLLSLLQGDHPQAYAQDIRWFGRRADSTRTLWQVRQRLGWMSPELHQHYPGEWSVLEVACSGFFNSIGLHQHCTPAQQAKARQALREVGLLAGAGEQFGALSFGQQRLVLLARAAVKRPRLLILDEPCQGLDAAQRQAFLAIVDRIVARTGASLVFVTHHAAEVPRCVTHLLRLERGRVRDTGRCPPRSG